MARSVYTIKHRGHEWQVSGGNAADIAQHYREQGATVKSRMKPENEPNGINIKRLTETELENLNRIAEANEWDQVSHMVRDEWATRL